MFLFESFVQLQFKSFIILIDLRVGNVLSEDKNTVVTMGKKRILEDEVKIFLTNTLGSLG